ncbi:J domain-containing protein, partial [archaeon]
DYYAVLGVPRTAELTEIKSAFRTLAKKWHPDVRGAEGDDGGAGADTFKRINEAYSVLSDSAERRMYDMSHPYAGMGMGGARAGAGRGMRTGSRMRSVYVRSDDSASQAEEEELATDRAAAKARAAASAAATAADPFDFEEWNRMHFGPNAKEAAWHAHQKVAAARATGFASVNNPSATTGVNWNARRAAKVRAEAWEAAQQVASDTSEYRKFANAFRESKARSTRQLPVTIVAWAGVFAALLYYSRKAASSR